MSSVQTETIFQPYYIHSSSKNITAPSSGSIATCQTNLEVPKKGGIIFSGSVSAKIISMFSSSIANHVTQVLETQICPSIKTDVDADWTKVLTKLDNFLNHLISTNRYLYLQQANPVESDKTVVNWDSDLAILKRSLIKTNQFLSSHMNRGIILSLLDKVGWSYGKLLLNDDNPRCNSPKTDCGLFFRGVNGLIRYVTNSGTINIVSKDNSRQFVFTIEKFGAVTLTLHSIQISGLDTFTKMALVPKDQHTIFFDVESDKGFEFEGRIELNVDPIEGGMIQGGSLHESFDLALNISSVSIETELDIAIIREKLEEISLGDAGIFHALLSSLSYVNFTQFQPQIQFDSFKVIPLFKSEANGDNSLEASIDEMINNIIQLFLNEYKLLWTEALIAFGQGPIRSHLNDALKHLIPNLLDRHRDNNQNATFLAPFKSSDGQYFHFDSNTLIERVHGYFSSKGVIDELNSFIGCVSSFLQNKTMRSNVSNSSSLFNAGIKEMSVSNINNINSIGECNTMYKVF